MSKRGSVDTAGGTGPFQELLREYEFDSAHVKIMLEVFNRVCRTLKVDDGSDPLSKNIARMVIIIASEGERDPDILYELALSRFHN